MMKMVETLTTPRLKSWAMFKYNIFVPVDSNYVIPFKLLDYRKMVETIFSIADSSTIESSEKTKS
jgi:hypothetical protein